MRMDFERIAIGFGGTEACRTALDRGCALAKRTGAALDLISVGIPIVPLGGFGWVAPYEDTHHIDALVRKRVRAAADELDPGLECTPHARIGNPAVEIVAAAAETNAALIVLGAVHHTQLERLFVGSTANRVLRLSRVPCLIAADPGIARRILVAADDGPFGEAAVHAALSLATATGAEVRCLHVARDPGGVESHVESLKEHLDAFVRRAREGLAASLPGGERPPEISVALRMGDVCDEIFREVAEFEADLLAVGTHGRGFVARTILGSTSEKLLDRSPVSVLIAPGPHDRE